MQGTKFKNLESIQQRGREALVKKTFSALGWKDGEDDLNKGGLGQFIEENWFGYKINNSSEPDFSEAGVELKVTPVKMNRHGKFQSKERLVLNIIDYMDEYKHPFEKSGFFKKNHLLYVLFYEYLKDKPKGEFPLIKDFILDYDKLSEVDKEIIKSDWETIVSFIKKGDAHLISEGDTLYLGACVKGATKDTTRPQPFNEVIPAKQRAFCFKSSFINEIAKLDDEKAESLTLFDTSEIRNTPFEAALKKRLSRYFGKTISELKNMFGISEVDNKGINNMLLAYMLGLGGQRLSAVSEFRKANIIPKTIRVERDGHIRESMSFPAFKYDEIIEETWEESSLKTMFDGTKFLFAVFLNNGQDYVFKGIKLWSMDEPTLDSFVKPVWEDTVEKIKTGKIIRYIRDNGLIETAFSKEKDNPVTHIRPHAQNKDDHYILPVPAAYEGRIFESFTKQCFWLNKEYIQNQIIDLLK